MLYSYFETVVSNIKEGDVVVYRLPGRNEITYWMVMETDFEDDTIYGRQVEHNCLTSFSYVPENEALQSRWISVADLELRATVELNRYEFKEPIGNLLDECKLQEKQKPQEEPQEEEHNEFDAMVYHVEYSLDYARGLSLKEILPSEVIKFEGNIVSKGKVWVFQTAMGCVIIPFESIIHMHPQY